MTVIAIFSRWEQNGSVIIQSKTVLAFMTYMVKGMLDELRDGPLEKLWGGGIFEPQEFFFVTKFLLRIFFSP